MKTVEWCSVLTCVASIFDIRIHSVEYGINRSIVNLEKLFVDNSPKGINVLRNPFENPVSELHTNSTYHSYPETVKVKLLPHPYNFPKQMSMLQRRHDMGFVLLELFSLIKVMKQCLDQCFFVESWFHNSWYFLRPFVPSYFTNPQTCIGFDKSLTN